MVPPVTFTALWWRKVLGEEGRLLLVSLPPRQQHPLPQAPAQSPPGTAPALFFFFFLMEEVKSSVYLAKKNPWNSSWPFLKYNKEAGLLATGRAALVSCLGRRSGSGEQLLPRGGRLNLLGLLLSGAGGSERGSCLWPRCPHPAEAAMCCGHGEDAVRARS